MTKGKRAGDGPIAVEVEKDKSYYWCSCGKSSKQPFCDASHKGTEFTPVVYKAEETKQMGGLFVMDHIIKSNIEIKYLLTTFKI
jgi:CDGSH-type Zn-finger protein